MLSTIIPAYNAERYLAETIESVLKQTHRPDEIVLVDDGSTDATARVAAQFGADTVRYFRQENRGVAAAMNAGLKLASGELIAFLDADDLWTPNKLEIQTGHLERDAALEIALGHQQRMWRPAGDGQWRFKEPELALALQSATIRRTVFDKVGLFDEGLASSCDWDWFFRARELGVRFLTHPEVASYYRRHDANMTRDEEKDHRITALVFKRSLDRRRARAGQAQSLPGLTLSECAKDQ
jgi:glycosyltransferase involved in cell wall biosynthesis